MGKSRTKDRITDLTKVLNLKKIPVENARL